MTPTDWIAIVGAAAWLPQIGSWAYRLLVKPELRLIPGPSPEVGFTSLGPIFNLTCALSASKKDAIVEKMTAELRHERGEQRLLTWALLNETFSELRNAAGEHAEFSKRQPAIALKVSTSLLSEKLICFQDSALGEEIRLLGNAATDTYQHFRRTDPEQAGVLSLKSKEHAAYIALFRRHQFWKPGKYDVTVRAYLADVKRPAVRQMSFTLSADDAAKLNANIALIEQVAFDVAHNAPAEQRQSVYWSWSNPQLDVSAVPAK